MEAEVEAKEVVEEAEGRFPALNCSIVNAVYRGG